MNPEDRLQLIRALETKESAQRRTIDLVAWGSVVAAAAVIAVMVYAGNARLARIRSQADVARSELAAAQERLSALEAEVQRTTARAKDLAATQDDLLNFLGDVAARESIRLIDPEVDWEATKASVLALPAGPRKSAILSAFLLAWKAIPFSLQNRGLARGLDSPHFVNAVLSRYQLAVEARPGERLSDAMMRTFQPTSSPEPGDLLFYRGNVGSFVVMLVAPGRPDGHGVAVGTLQTGEELRVLDTALVNTPVYPFIGAFRVPYPSR